MSIDHGHTAGHRAGGGQQVLHRLGAATASRGPRGAGAPGAVVVVVTVIVVVARVSILFFCVVICCLITSNVVTTQNLGNKKFVRIDLVNC